MFYEKAMDVGWARRHKRQSGIRDIALAHEPSAYLVLTVRDNGIGLPEGYVPELSDSFGLVLVSSLVAQLDGTLQTEQYRPLRFGKLDRWLPYRLARSITLTKRTG